MDIIVEITFNAIINSLSIDNFKNEPSILSSHPVFLSSLKYFNDEKWQIICDMIIETPKGFRGDNWRKRSDIMAAYMNQNQVTRGTAYNHFNKWANNMFDQGKDGKIVFLRLRDDA